MAEGTTPFAPSVIETEPIIEQVDRLRETGIAVAQAVVPEAVCLQLDHETSGVCYVPDESWRSLGGSRRPLFIGQPRSALEQWLLSRPGLVTLRETGLNIWDALREGGVEPPDINRAVINSVKSASHPGLVQVGRIEAHVDPEHYKGVVAAVSLQDGVLNLYAPNKKGGKGKRVSSEPVRRGDVGFFLCADLAEEYGVVRLLHEVMNEQGIDQRKSVAYSHSAIGPLTALGIFQRFKQHFQRPE